MLFSENIFYPPKKKEFDMPKACKKLQKTHFYFPLSKTISLQFIRIKLNPIVYLLKWKRKICSPSEPRAGNWTTNMAKTHNRTGVAKMAPQHCWPEKESWHHLIPCEYESSQISKKIRISSGIHQENKEALRASRCSLTKRPRKS